MFSLWNGGTCEPQLFVAGFLGHESGPNPFLHLTVSRVFDELPSIHGTDTMKGAERSQHLDCFAWERLQRHILTTKTGLWG